MCVEVTRYCDVCLSHKTCYSVWRVSVTCYCGVCLSLVTVVCLSPVIVVSVTCYCGVYLSPVTVVCVCHLLLWYMTTKRYHDIDGHMVLSVCDGHVLLMIRDGHVLLVHIYIYTAVT